MKCEHVRHTSKIDLREWGFDTEHNLADALVGTIVTPIIRGQFEKTPPEISTPFYWSTSDDDGHGGPPVENPLTLDIQLPLGENEEPVVYRTTLEEVIDDEFFFENLEPVDADKVARVADELERIAAKIRERITAVRERAAE